MNQVEARGGWDEGTDALTSIWVDVSEIGASAEPVEKTIMVVDPTRTPRVRQLAMVRPPPPPAPPSPSAAVAQARRPVTTPPLASLRPSFSSRPSFTSGSVAVPPQPMSRMDELLVRGSIFLCAFVIAALCGTIVGHRFTLPGPTSTYRQGALGAVEAQTSRSSNRFDILCSLKRRGACDRTMKAHD